MPNWFHYWNRLPLLWAAHISESCVNQSFNAATPLKLRARTHPKHRPSLNQRYRHPNGIQDNAHAEYLPGALTRAAVRLRGALLSRAARLPLRTRTLQPPHTRRRRQSANPRRMPPVQSSRSTLRSESTTAARSSSTRETSIPRTNAGAGGKRAACALCIERRTEWRWAVTASTYGARLRGAQATVGARPECEAEDTCEQKRQAAWVVSLVEKDMKFHCSAKLRLGRKCSWLRTGTHEATRRLCFRASHLYEFRIIFLDFCVV